MKTRFVGCMATILVIASISPALADKKPWNINAPVPAGLSGRTFLDPSQEAGYRDKVESLVGYWGVLSNGVVTVSSTRPASFLTQNTSVPPVVKITIQKSDPIYSSILDSSSGVKAAIPVLNFSWGQSEKGQITITDTAQFMSDRLPTDDDATAISKYTVGAGKQIVYVESALLSVVQTAVLKSHTGALDFLYDIFSIGGNTYENENGTATTFVVTVGVRQTLCQQLGNCAQSNEVKTLAQLNKNELNYLTQSVATTKAHGGFDFSYSLPRQTSGAPKSKALALVPLKKRVRIVLSKKPIQDLLK